MKGVKKDKNNIGHENGKLGRNRNMVTKRKKGKKERRKRGRKRERKEKERKRGKEITKPSRNRENYRKSHEYSSGRA